MKKVTVMILAVCLSLAFCITSARAEDKGEVKCHMGFSMHSWSVFYKSGKGTGTITCDNGQKASVKLRSHGGGITFGKSKIVNGEATFSKVSSINELFGGYASVGGDAGAGKSAGGQSMTKGEVSMSLSGTGKGVDIGFDFGKFKITRK